MITAANGTVETYRTVHYRVVELKIGETNVDYKGSIDFLEGTADDWKVINSAPVELDDDSTARLSMNNNRQMISISGKKTWVTNKPLDDFPDLTLKLISWTESTSEQKKEWTAVETAEGIQDYQYVILPEDDENPLEGDTSTSRLKWYKNGKTWNYAFTYLPKYDPETRELLQYKVEELMSGTNADAFSQESIPGQSTETGDITNWDFVNTEKTSIKVIKHWKTNDQTADGDPFDPDRKVKVELYRKGNGTTLTMGIFEISKNDDPAEGEEKWQLVIPDLPKYYTDENGDLQTYSYYVIERDTGIWHVEYSTDGEKYTVAANQADAQDETHPIHLENSAWTVALRSTGGPGSNLLYLLGSLMLAFGSAGLVMRKRRRMG